jgi:Cu-processing system permease protein
MRPLIALTLAGFREAIRNRVTVVVGVFAIALILLTSVVMNVTVFSVDRVVTDFGLGVMSLILLGLALFMSVGMLSREIEKRTVFLVVSRPLSRAYFVVGRYLGVVVTLTILLLAMSAIYATQIFFFGVPPTGAMVAAVVGLWFELLVIASMGICFSAFAGNVTSTVCVLSLYFIGHLTPDIYALAPTMNSPALAGLAKLSYYVMPNLDRMDFKHYAAYGHPVEGTDVALSGAVAGAWVVLFVTCATLIFARRDFK